MFGSDGATAIAPTDCVSSASNMGIIIIGSPYTAIDLPDIKHQYPLKCCRGAEVILHSATWPDFRNKRAPPALSPCFLLCASSAFSPPSDYYLHRGLLSKNRIPRLPLQIRSAIRRLLPPVQRGLRRNLQVPALRPDGPLCEIHDMSTFSGVTGNRFFQQSAECPRQNPHFWSPTRIATLGLNRMFRRHRTAGTPVLRLF